MPGIGIADQNYYYLMNFHRIVGLEVLGPRNYLFYGRGFKSVPDGAFSNRVALGIGCVGAESLGPFLRLNSGMAHVDVGPSVPACTPELIKCGMEKWNPIGEPGPRRSPCAAGSGLGSSRAWEGRMALSGLKIAFSRYSYA